MKYNTTLIVGKNKTGKTRKIIFKDLEEKIKNKENLYILDNNKEYYNHFYKELKDNDYVIQAVNFKEPTKSDGWNPLSYPAYLRNEGKLDESVEVLESMANEIFYQEKEEDPFWRLMSQNLFVGLSLLLYRIGEKVDDKHLYEFPTLMLLLKIGEEKYKDSTVLKKYLELLDPTDPIYIALSPIVFAPTETKGSILSVFKTKINLYLLREELVKSFTNNSYSEAKIPNTSFKNHAIFIIGNDSLNRLTNIVIENSFREALKNSSKSTFIIDEFDKLPKMLEINTMINKANRNNIDLYLTATTMDNIIDKYGKLDNIQQTIETKDYYESNDKDENIEIDDQERNHFYENNYIDRLRKEIISTM